MNGRILRNWEQRKALQERISEMNLKREAELDALSDELTDEEYDTASDSIWERYDTSALHRKMFSLEYKESRNKWFKNFVQSFGLCDAKRITRKQGEILMRYSEPNHERESGRGMKYFVRVDNLFITTQVFSEREPCFVTIEQIK